MNLGRFFGKTIPQMSPHFDEAEGRALFDFMKKNQWNLSSTNELEKMLADFTGSGYGIFSVNGTLTLTLALLALDIKPGDEVLVPASTMIATANACALIGIRPVLVDVEPSTLCVDLEKATEAITPKTKAMMYVPLNGRSGNMDRVTEFAKSHKLFLIEDAAQALGSYWKGERSNKKHLGTFGDIGSFSFSLYKIITTGQGGALVTDNEELQKKINLLKNFGQTSNDIHDYPGWNFKFSNILAVIGLEQFKKLPERINRKKEIYKYYYDRLSSIPDVEFIPTNLDITTPWFIDIFLQDRDGLAEFLKTKGVGTRNFYPAINTQKIYREEYLNKSFPVAEHCGRRGLWLPSATQLTNEELEYITDTIALYFKK